MLTLPMTEQIVPPAALSELAMDGYTIVRGVDPLHMNEAMERMGLQLGTTTNTLGLISAGASKPLPVHVEGLYHADTTPYLLLGCIGASAVGGETQVYDARTAARIMLDEWPQADGIQFEHRAALHPGVKSITPLIDQRGDTAVLRFCDTPENNRFTQTPEGFNETEFYEFARNVLRRSLVHSQTWNEGDVLIINNGITLHGRSPFEGQRRMLRVRVDDPVRKKLW